MDSRSSVRLPARRPAHPPPDDQTRRPRRARPAHRRPLPDDRHYPEETTAYISHHLELAGRTSLLFPDDALTLIHDTSRGKPRTVNNLAFATLVATTKKFVNESAARAAVTEVIATE